MDTFRKRPIRYPLLFLFVLGLLTAILIGSWNFWVGLSYALAFYAIAYYAWKVEKISFFETEKHIESISYRMKDVGEEALLQMPIGIHWKQELRSTSLMLFSSPFPTK